MVCYKGGIAVEENFQMCDVTSESDFHFLPISRRYHGASTDGIADRKIIDTIPDDKPPQVTFSCTANGLSSNMTSLAPDSWPYHFFADSPDLAQEAQGQCSFQFWVDRIESFHCKLDGCSWQSKESSGELI